MIRPFLRWLSRKPEPTPDPLDAARLHFARYKADYDVAHDRGDTRSMGHFRACMTWWRSEVLRLEVERARRRAA